MLPVNIFLLNRNKVEIIANKIPNNFLNKDEIHEIKQLWNKNLIKYKEIYSNTRQWNMIYNLVLRGIGIHHSGLIPILKEIIEILYSKKLIKVLLATETFALGVNMPTKAVIFTQLTKFDGTKRRNLRPEEYNQMAGRAGRRGLDDFGSVIIIPDKYCISEIDAKHIILSKPQKIESKLKIDYNFILKRMVYKIENNDNTPIIEYLQKAIKDSMFAREKVNEIDIMRKRLSKIELIENDSIKKYINEYKEIQKIENQITNNNKSIIKKSKKFIKKLQMKKNALEKNIPKENIKILENYYKKIKQKEKLEKDIIIYDNNFVRQITHLCKFLETKNIIDSEYNLTSLGRIIAEINECNPLILGYIISENHLDDLEFPEIIAYLSIFISDKSIEPPDFSNLLASKKIMNKLEDIDYLVNELIDYETKNNQEMPFIFWSDWELHLSLFNAIKLWADMKNWDIVSQYYPTFEGNFIRNVLRLVNLIRNVESIAKLTNNIKLLNKLDGYQEKLIRDVVITESLYL